MNNAPHLVWNYEYNKTDFMATPLVAKPGDPSDWEISQFGPSGYTMNDMEVYLYEGLPIMSTDISSFNYRMFRGVLTD